MSKKNIYQQAALNTVQSLPKRFVGWVLGVYAAELIKLRAVEQTKKDILADLITKQTRRR